MNARFLLILSFALVFAHAEERRTSVPPISVSLHALAGSYFFMVRNAGPNLVYYTGYGGAEGGAPIFFVEVLCDGVWTKKSLGWCGVGLGECFIRAKSGLDQAVHPGSSFEIMPGQRFRVGVDFTSKRMSDL